MRKPTWVARVYAEALDRDCHDRESSSENVSIRCQTELIETICSMEVCDAARQSERCKRDGVGGRWQAAKLATDRSRVTRAGAAALCARHRRGRAVASGRAYRGVARARQGVPAR